MNPSRAPINSGTRKLPIPRICTKPCLHRIAANVGANIPIMIFVPDQAVMIVRHPQSAFTTDSSIDFESGCSLPRLDHGSQRMLLKLLDQDMNMVRHHAPVNQSVGHFMLPHQFFLHDSGASRVLQHAGAMTQILIPGDPAEQRGFRLPSQIGVFRQQLAFQLPAPLRYDRRGQGIRQTEGDRLKISGKIAMG